MNRSDVLDVPHIGGAFDSGLLHRLAEIIRVYELARLLDALPIEKQDNFARIVNGMEDAATRFRQHACGC